MRTSIPVAVAALLWLASCGKQLNPEYCASFGKTDPDCQNGGLVVVDAAPRCSTDMQCMSLDPARPACDLDSNTCVECWTDAHSQRCTGATPVCGTDDQCHTCLPPNKGCSTGQTCVEGEGCVDPVSDILYASPGVAPGHACTQTDHCSLSDAVTKLNAGPAHAIQIDDGDYPSGPYTITAAGTVAVFSSSGNADGVKITLGPGGTGSVVTIATTGTVNIQHVSIHDGTVDGITCTHGTIAAHDLRLYNNGGAGLASSGCMVALDRSDVHDNQSIGLSLDGSAIQITNNFIRNNGALDATGGNGGSNVGGVGLTGGTSGKIKFNTIAFNNSKRHGVGGLACQQAGPVNATANIVAGNFDLQYRQGACTVAPIYALSTTGVFVSTTDLHLAPTAPKPALRDNPAADCNDVPEDYDGDMRPNPGGYCDLGADEL
jgi:hypothetical protein